VLATCPHLDATATHVNAFAEMLTGRHGDRLDSWMASVDTDDLAHLHRFVTGLRRDYHAVRNGLTLSHNSGTVEGTVNRIKMIKRQMYGAPNSTCSANACCSPHDDKANSITESAPDPVFTCRRQ
jgi:transposase